MNSLSSILGGASVAVITATGAVNADDNVITTVQASPPVERVQLYDLPNIQLDLFDSTEEQFRNPGNRVAIPVPYDSVGEGDERRAPRMGEGEYDSVVQMQTPTGLCTATVSDIDGFEARESGTIFTTAAHCLDIKDQQGNIIGQYGPEDITFHGSYLDSSGDIQEFHMQGDEAWVNPLYRENLIADAESFYENGHVPDTIIEADTAVVFSRQVTPNEVTPARVITTDFEKATNIRDAIYQDQANEQGFRVTVAGHSADKPYLTAHENARVTFGDIDGINTESDIVPGASGGPVLVSGGDDQPVALTEEGSPVVVAVNSTVTEGTDSSRHSYFNANTLKTTPFLKPEGDVSGEICEQTGEITASSLKIRTGPDVSFQELAKLGGQENSQLPMGSKVTIHGTTQNELGQEWGLVSTPEGRTGYVSMNPDYVEQGPEVCSPVESTP